MTAQISEKLILDGNTVAMCAEPLAMYFSLGGHSPAFRASSTALWRGYVGTWEIRAGRLYLIGISATLENGAEATLESVFPGFPDRVFAHWYSDTLRIPEGKLINYVHMGYASTYERDRLIRIERGIVVGSELRQNGEATSEGSPNEYVIGAMTVFGTDRRDEE